MVDLDLLTAIHTDVKFMRQSFEDHREEFRDHVQEDKDIRNEYLKPLWESHQQNLGATKTRGVGGMFLDKAATIGIAVVAAWAAVKGIKGG